MYYSRKLFLMLDRIYAIKRVVSHDSIFTLSLLSFTSLKDKAGDILYFCYCQ